MNRKENGSVMNINFVDNAIYNKRLQTKDNITEKSIKAFHHSNINNDTISISENAYKAYVGTEAMKVTSGQDELPVTKGDFENSFVIHFKDSAMVNRAISRGYITVNGTTIKLSCETKKQLKEIDEMAQICREKAYSQYVMKHQMAVAKQQSEAIAKAIGRMSDASEIAASLSRGGEVSDADIKKLLDSNPLLYMMTMISKNMAERNEIQKEKAREAYKNFNFSGDGVSWSQFEWKTYETQMTISLGSTPFIQNISKGEVVLNKGI